MIEVKNLTKRYGDHLALDNISFTVEDGTIVGFLGPNGAGKSTTMNIITGYISATEGQVLIDGIDVLESPLEAKKKIGYLPEIPPLYADMTVNEYLTFVCELKNVPAKDRDKMLEDICKQVKLHTAVPRLRRRRLLRPRSVPMRMNLLWSFRTDITRISDSAASSFPAGKSSVCPSRGFS